MDESPLDNPVWSSMTTAHVELANFAELAELADLAEPADSAGAGGVSGRGAGAGRYQRDVSPFGGLADDTDAACWKALDELLDGHGVVLIASPACVPDGWEITFAGGGLQMLGTRLADQVDADAVTLTGADVPAMLELIDRTRPGPFLPRTIEMGRYIGVRSGDRLVAMAGVRLHPSGWTEISAVCTDDTHRGTGLATRLVRTVAADIRARGDHPFLHVADTNLNAIRLYQSIGFEIRRQLNFIGVRRRRP